MSCSRTAADDPVLPATDRATIRRKADFPRNGRRDRRGRPIRSARFVAGEFRVLLGIPDRPRSASTRWTARRWAHGRCRTRHAEELRFCESGPSANASSMAGLRPAGRQVPPRWGHPSLWPHLEEAYRGRKRRPQRAPRPTPREWRVLDLVAQGHSNAEIACTLVTSLSTVRTHLENILARIGVHSRSAAVALKMPPAATGPVRSRPAPHPTSFDQPR